MQFEIRLLAMYGKKMNFDIDASEASLRKFAKRIEWLKEAKREQVKKIKTLDLQMIAAQNAKEKVHPMFTGEATVET